MLYYVHGAMFILQNLSSTDIHATSINDITDVIQSIIDSVQNFTSPEDCCGYELQLLDKFCASQNEVRLQGLT